MRYWIKFRKIRPNRNSLVLGSKEKQRNTSMLDQTGNNWIKLWLNKEDRVNELDSTEIQWCSNQKKSKETLTGLFVLFLVSYFHFRISLIIAKTENGNRELETKQTGPKILDRTEKLNKEDLVSELDWTKEHRWIQ